MAVTDQQLLSDVQYRTLETVDNGATVSSGIWTPTELISYLNERHRRFIASTRLWMTIASQSAVIGTATYSTNDFGGAGSSADLVDIYRLAYLTAVAVSYELQRGDTWAYDHGPTSAWYTTNGTPETWTLVTEPTVQIRVIPAPDAAGTLKAVYTALGTALSNSGITINIPDELAPYLVWGILADMLAKEGEAHDPERAAYCEARFEEGIALALALNEEA